MEKITYYSILGVSPSATEEEIKTAYRFLMKKFHPDANVGAKIDTTPFVEQINLAYSILSDSCKRAVYDSQLKGTVSSPSGPQPPTADDSSRANDWGGTSGYRWKEPPPNNQRYYSNAQNTGGHTGERTGDQSEYRSENYSQSYSGYRWANQSEDHTEYRSGPRTGRRSESRTESHTGNDTGSHTKCHPEGKATQKPKPDSAPVEPKPDSAPVSHMNFFTGFILALIRAVWKIVSTVLRFLYSLLVIVISIGGFFLQVILVLYAMVDIVFLLWQGLTHTFQWSLENTGLMGLAASAVLSIAIWFVIFVVSKISEACKAISPFDILDLFSDMAS